MPHILLVEDDEDLSMITHANLACAGHQVDDAFTCAQAEKLLSRFRYDLILLDIMLPKMIGFDVCEALRKDGDNVPILLLTAREEEDDKVRGLELGADDYITKPFKNRELLARVKANIRRVSMSAPPPPAAPAAEQPLGERMHIDEDRAAIFKDGAPLDLTQREYDLIRFLAARPGKVFSREALMEHVWNYEGYVGDVRAVDVAVRRLREKIEDDPGSPVFIKTKRGMGYYFGE